MFHHARATAVRAGVQVSMACDKECARVYQNEGPGNEAFERGVRSWRRVCLRMRERRTCLTLVMVMYWLLGGNEPSWVLPAPSDVNEKWTVGELKRGLERAAPSLGNLVNARIGERCWCLRYGDIRE